MSGTWAVLVHYMQSSPGLDLISLVIFARPPSSLEPQANLVSFPWESKNHRTKYYYSAMLCKEIRDAWEGTKTNG